MGMLVVLVGQIADSVAVEQACKDILSTHGAVSVLIK
jgi:hypothetical protein